MQYMPPKKLQYDDFSESCSALVLFLCHTTQSKLFFLHPTYLLLS